MTVNPVKRTDQSDWYLTTQQGKKVGYIWPSDLLILLESVWGERKGIKNFALWAGFDRKTVERWCNGTTPTPRYAALLAHLVEERCIVAQEGKPNPRPWEHLPVIEADWLPGWEDFKNPLDMKPFDEYD